MVILELNFEKGWRGGERQTLYNMIGFQQAGHEVHLICRKGCPLEQKAREAGFVTHGYSSVWKVIGFLISKGRRYTLLHAQTAQILTYAVFTKFFHGRPVFFSRRVDFVPKGFFTQLKYLKTDKILAISKAIQKIVTEFTGRKDIELVSSVVVPQDLNKERALQLLAAKEIAPGTAIVGTMAALVQHKDPLTMVQAIAALKKLRTDFVFLHFGKGDLLPLVQQKIEELGLQQQYKLMGFHERVEDFFAVLDVFVMSSEEEGLGSSVLDAFVYKVPVVTTNAGGLAELGADNRAILCNKYDAAAIGKGIDEVLKDGAVKEKMTGLAAEYAHAYHSMEYIVKQYLQIMDNFVAKKKRI